MVFYRDPAKKGRQKLQLLLLLAMAPVGAIGGVHAYRQWSSFHQAEAAFQQGDAMLHAGRVPDAGACFERSVALYPEFYGAWEGLAATHHLTHHHDRELDAYRRAVQALPERGELHRELGTAYHEAGQHEQELVQLQRASQLLPGDVFTMRLLDRAQREKDGTYPTVASAGHDTAPPAAGPPPGAGSAPRPVPSK
jgi:tetratricopeptide (TPR) repeat protein